MAYFGIYGVGAFTRCIYQMILEKIKREELPGEKVFFIDDNYNEFQLFDHKVISFEQFCELNGKKFGIVAIANPQIRSDLTRKLEQNDIGKFNLISNDFISFQNVTIGEGSIICARFTATCDIEIGHSFHGNIGGLIEHDCRIGDFVTFSPGAICNGNVIIEDNVFIGSGAIIRNGDLERPLVIGDDSIIGMGSFVLNDVKPRTIVAGNPGREIKESIS